MKRAIVITALLGACGISEERAEDQWSAFVEEHNECTDVSECAIVYPGCPLGCYEAVAQEHVSEAQTEAQRIIDKYERGGRACAYSCAEAPSLVCENQRCGFAE
jgi:hypothetical protein